MDAELEELINISDEIWNDLAYLCTISYMPKFAAGFRFRYQSEIDKKSYSLLKAEGNIAPVVKVNTYVDDAIFVLQLVTEKDENPHFNMIYEVMKEKSVSYVNDGIFSVHLSKPGDHEIKLENLGIRKMKSKEAIERIQKIYPEMKVSDAKAFFNKHKDIVRLKATILIQGSPSVYVISDTIKSQISKENKNIKIKHFSPKVVAETGEELIVVLEKKITTNEFKTFLTINDNEYSLKSIEEDGQTFIFCIPPIVSPTAFDAKFWMVCGDSRDSKLIKFLASTNEPRKRKINAVMNNELPLKRPTNDRGEAVTQPYPETTHIETDGTINDTHLPTMTVDYPNDNDSCHDSGIHSNDRLSDKNLSDDEMDCSDGESSDECVEVEGFRRRRDNVSPERLIRVNGKVRSSESRLDSANASGTAAKKIFSEIARIGHDFAFGKTSSDLFERIENQLPVVFTLQDDVGDTPLNNAILKGNVANARKILRIVQKHCEWALDLVNTSGHSALILAPACDVPSDFIEDLLKAGCKLDLWDDTGKSALIYAIEYRNTPALEVLLNHVKRLNLTSLLSRYETCYYTPLQIALMHGFQTGVQMLLELKDCNGKYMVDVNETGLMNGESALHIAVSHECDVEMIELLLSRSDLNINQTLSNKTTALHVATKMKLFEIISLLKAHDAVDLSPGSETDFNVDDSDEEVDEENDDNLMNCIESDPLIPERKCSIEMNVYQESQTNNNVNGLTESMRQMSLSGDLKHQLINLLLLSNEPTLNIMELQQIVKPQMMVIFKKYGNTENHRKDITELLDRMNCLPDSVGQLVESLQKIKRFDLVEKIQNNLASKLERHVVFTT